MKSTATNTIYCLVIEDSKSQRNITLEQDIYSIGRHPQSAIVIDSPQASRHHATLVRRQNLQQNRSSFWIIDGDLEGQQSHNGVYINGKSCLAQELKNGDLINFGCGVNASYHVIQDSLQNKRIIKDLSSVHDASTLILDDISELLEAELNPYETHQSLSFNDPLTHLPTQTLFREHFSLALKNAERQDYSMAIISINLSDFTEICQQLGNDLANKLLQKVAQVLNACVRSADIVARWADSEFMILLTKLNSPADGDLVKQRILQNLQKPINLQHEGLSLHFKIGMALYPQVGITLTELEDQARAQTVSCDSLIASKFSETQISSLKKVESSLLNALKQQQLALFYQPQVDRITGQIVAMEALLRWHHPLRGLVTPHRFIGAAEQTEAILPLCEWILETACQQNRQWQDIGLSPLKIGVNLSYRQLELDRFAYLVAQVLTKTGLDPQWLELEISEKSLLTNISSVGITLKRLNQLGISLSLDDFGTGYSSLTHLLQFPFKKLKIAQACVQQLTNDLNAFRLIASIIAATKSLDLTSVAEGVETSAQFCLLQQLECEQIQGFLISRPLTVEQATDFLKTYRASIL